MKTLFSVLISIALGGCALAQTPPAVEDPAFRAPPSPPSSSTPTILPAKSAAEWVEGRVGHMVRTPYGTSQQWVDVTGHAPGTEVKCPYSGKLFRIPEIPGATPSPGPEIRPAAGAPGASPGAPANAVTGPRANLSKVTFIHVVLDKQWLIARGPEGERVCPISSGKSTTQTPTGIDFKVEKKELSYVLKGVRDKEGRTVTMPYWLMIIPADGIGIHGVNSSWGGDYPASKGCIRVTDPEDQKWLFEHTAEGTPGKITGTVEQYLANNAVFPWQQEGVKDLLEPDGSGGYKFRKHNVTREMRETLKTLLRAGTVGNGGRLGFYRAPPRRVKQDWRWGVEDNRFLNFPNIPEMGSPGEQSFDACTQRYWTYKELCDLLGDVRILKR